MNKKILSLVLALIMVFSLFTPAFADEETEKTDAVEAAVETAPVTEEFIEFLKEHKIIMGDAKGDLMLDKEIDRASFAALLARMDNKEDAAKAVQALPSRFKDMSPADWANGYANLVADQGWMKGNEKGEFMPRKNISYAEIATTLVRFLGTDTAGFVYPTSFIAKGFELGLWDGVRKIENYNQPAIRKDIFRMVYNAISKEDFGRYTVYKMIVLENSRVAQLGANEIKAEILDVVQMPNKVSERGIGKVGEQIKFNIEGLKLDTEFLLGKVANFSIDENGKLVKVVIDETYDYVWGEFRANEKNFAIARRNYGVRVDERYWKIDGQRYDNDDRMYRTYVTSGYRAANFHYIDFVKQIKDKKIAPNMARVTAKDGMVIFIDAFAYTDIAPVKEVARDGQDVYYYNDARDGAVEVMRPADRVIGYSEKEGFHNIKASDIKANDVIHWMTGFTLVRQDAELTGKLEKTHRNERGEFARIGENDYFLNSDVDKDAPFRSVYAYDNTNFRTLPSRGAIEDMRGDDVIVLLDVMGEIQLISSHRKYSDNVALINRVVSSKGQGFWAPNKEENYTLAEDWNSNYITVGLLQSDKACIELSEMIAKGKNVPTITTNTDPVSIIRGSYYIDLNTREQAFAKFNYADLVYVQSNEEKIGVSAVMVPFSVYDACMKPAVFEQYYGRTINVGGKDYRYNQDTDVFAYNVDGQYVYLGKADMAEIYKYNKDNLDLNAYVVTESDYKNYLENILEYKTYNRLHDRDDYARIIIFRDYKGKALELGPVEYAKVLRVDNYSNALLLETSRGITEEIQIVNHRNVNLNNLKTGYCGSFIAFRRVKAEDNTTNKAKFIEELKMKQVVIKDRYNDGFLTTNDERVFIDNYTKEFGSSRDIYARIYQLKGSDYAEVVDYTDRACGYKACELTELDKYQIKSFLAFMGILEKKSTCCSADDAEDLEKAREAYNKLSDCAKAEVVKEYKRLLFFEGLADPQAGLRADFISRVTEIEQAIKDKKDDKVVMAMIEEAEAVWNALTSENQEVKEVSDAKGKLDTAKTDVKARLDAEKNKEAQEDWKKYAKSIKNYIERQDARIANAEVGKDKLVAKYAKYKKIYTDARDELKTLVEADMSSSDAETIKAKKAEVKAKQAEVDEAFKTYVNHLR